ncbi:PREDICTED: AN1-type zinc finger protein 2A-like [Polistes dominula]|uniref:AN1-type zinc finger protein 2A-like n=1 Tax=Polistes dominula TaxID=743375 RepID=A0ABM1ICJ6_POLDO|nr:PREDICTED: AN1-type zinc finger protein 2A-like [Polistes dominula]
MYLVFFCDKAYSIIVIRAYKKDRFSTYQNMEFPNLGEHCSEQTCNRLDFLPLKCDACEAIFCTDHISYINHSCPSAYKKDIQVPVCPLCNNPVPQKRGDPPDLAVSMHIDSDCQSDVRNDRRKIFSNKCSSKGCKVKEIVQVKCNDCGSNFCLKHRHPSDHACIGKEEAVRLKRLSNLNKRTMASQNDNHNNSVVFRNLQGTMSEDEALARALQASLQDEGKNTRQGLQPVPSAHRNRCRLS